MKKKYVVTIVCILVLVTLSWIISLNKGYYIRAFLSEARSHFSLEKSGGIVSYDSLRWCNLPVSHDLDKGGIPDDLRDIQHPSVCYIENGWNGANVWMCATPYPQVLKPHSGEPYENACIFFANSGMSAPTDFFAINKNPIIYKDGASYNSDSDIFFDDADRTMYCVTRKRRGKDYMSRFVIQSSKDGQTWSEPVILFDVNNEQGAVSPCLIKYKNKYRVYVYMYAPENSRVTDGIDIYESESLKEPKFSLYKSLKWKNNVNVWHGDIIEYKGKLLLVGCGMKNHIKTRFGIKDQWRYLYLGVSDDGENFRMMETPLLQSTDVYRSTGYMRV
jgi:hypothetical protein